MLDSGTNGVKIGFAVSGKANPHGSLYNPKDATKPLSSARLYTSLFVRHWDSYVEPQKNAIWYGLLQIRPSASGLRQRYSLSGLTNLMAVSGLEGVESPIPPFGGADHVDISPAAIVFVAKDPDLNPATHTSCICYYCPMFSLEAVGIRETCRLPTLQGAMTSPALSSDGSSIILLLMMEDGYESDKNRVMYVPNPWDGKTISFRRLMASASGR
jgi:pre-mRNA-splicing helicase BRR2